MTTIKVPDMMCENCVKRITNALTAAELTFRVDLAAKNVTIDGCENCVKTAVSELEDLGFTPEVQGSQAAYTWRGAGVRFRIPVLF